MHNPWYVLQSTIQGEGFGLFINPRLGGGGILDYTCHGFMRGHRQIAWGGEPKRGKPIPCLAGGVLNSFMKTPY